ncbi:MAG: hypothetical protein MZW92_00090 [Comamonadaceae bacterium]|nr:hypothetical protein [Comamonadaceae bacterium]
MREDLAILVDIGGEDTKISDHRARAGRAVQQRHEPGGARPAPAACMDTLAAMLQHAQRGGGVRRGGRRAARPRGSTPPAPCS